MGAALAQEHLIVKEKFSKEQYDSAIKGFAKALR